MSGAFPYFIQQKDDLLKIFQMIERGHDPREFFNITGPGTGGYNIFHVAIYLDVATQTLQRLVEAGANVNAEARNGKTAWDIAVSRSTLNFDTLHFLIDQGVDLYRKHDHQTPLQAVLFRGTEALFRAMLEKGANPHFLLGGQQTALHALCQRPYECLDRVSLFVDYGVKVHRLDGNQRHALHYSAEAGHLQITQFLIEHGLDINLQDYKGFSPLQLAAKNGRMDMVALLMESGADSTLANKKGQTAKDLIASPLKQAAFERMVLDRALPSSSLKPLASRL